MAILRCAGQGAHVRHADDQGYTALHLAAGDGHIEVCRTLLRHGAAVASIDSEGWDA